MACVACWEGTSGWGELLSREQRQEVTFLHPQNCVSSQAHEFVMPHGDTELTLMWRGDTAAEWTGRRRWATLTASRLGRGSRVPAVLGVQPVALLR